MNSWGLRRQQTITNNTWITQWALENPEIACHNFQIRLESIKNSKRWYARQTFTANKLKTHALLRTSICTLIILFFFLLLRKTEFLCEINMMRFLHYHACLFGDFGPFRTFRHILLPVASAPTRFIVQEFQSKGEPSDFLLRLNPLCSFVHVEARVRKNRTAFGTWRKASC